MDLPPLTQEHLLNMLDDLNREVYGIDSGRKPFSGWATPHPQSRPAEKPKDPQ